MLGCLKLSHSSQFIFSSRFFFLFFFLCFNVAHLSHLLVTNFSSTKPYLLILRSAFFISGTVLLISRKLVSFYKSFISLLKFSSSLLSICSTVITFNVLVCILICIISWSVLSGWIFSHFVCNFLFLCMFGNFFIEC